MIQNYKKGDSVSFRKITKGNGSSEVYHGSGVIEKFDNEGNAHIKEEANAEQGIKPAIHVVPIANLVIAD